MSQIYVHPITVLHGLARTARVRTERSGEQGLQLWSSVIWGPTKGRSARATLRAARIVYEVCSEVDQEVWAGDVPIEESWLSEISGTKSESEFGTWVTKTHEATESTGISEASISRAKADGLLAEVDNLLSELRAVADPAQERICSELVEHLESEVIPAVQRSIELKLWLLRRELLEEIGAQLFSFGMRLRASGGLALAERVFLVLLSASSVLMGLADPVLGASLGVASLVSTVKGPTEVLGAMRIKKNEAKGSGRIANKETGGEGTQ